MEEDVVFFNHKKFFDDTIKMLRVQGKQAKKKTQLSCSYRLKEGGRVLKCAIGMHIPDDMYDPRMETKSAHTLCTNYPQFLDYLVEKYKEGGDKAYKNDVKWFLNELQSIHDCMFPQLIGNPEHYWFQLRARYLNKKEG